MGCLQDHTIAMSVSMLPSMMWLTAADASSTLLNQCPFVYKLKPDLSVEE